MPKQIIDVDRDFFIIPYNNGVQLIKPEEYQPQSIIKSDAYSVNELFKLPLSVYFLNLNSEIQYGNDVMLEIIGSDSLKEIIHENAFYFTNYEMAKQLIINDKKVTDSLRMEVFEEGGTPLRNVIPFSGLSVKFPWYQDSKIQGVFGCSLFLGKDTLNCCMQLLKLILQINNSQFLSAANQIENNLPGIILNNAYLTRRESECLALLAKGKTAKESAKVLGLSPRTVEHYLENLKSKCAVNSRSELIDLAVERGFLNINL